MRHSLLPLLLLASAVLPRPAWAAAPPLRLALNAQCHVRFDETGAWRLETRSGPLLVNCGLRIWTQAGYRKQSDARPLAEPGRGPLGHSFHGAIRVGAATTRYWQTVTPVPDGLLVQYAVAAESLPQTDSERGGTHIAAAFDLPVETFRGAPCTVAAPAAGADPASATLPPETPDEPRLLEVEGATALAIRRDRLQIHVLRRPSGKVLVQDARAWHRPCYQAVLHARRGVEDPPGWRSVAFLLTVTKPPEGPVVAAVAPGPSPVPCGDIHEAEVRFWAAYDNPFRPQDVRVWAEVQGPAGRRFQMPGFLARDHHRSREGRAEVLQPVGHGRWRLRLTPTTPGTYRYTVHVATPRGAAASRPVEFAAGAADAPGFLLPPREPSRYLQFADGTPCFLLGHNCAWPDPKAGTYALDTMLDAMGRAGLNAGRLWLCSWGIHIEGKEPDRYRLDHAWRLDHVLRRARERGVRVQVCLDNLTDLTAEAPDAANPYLARHGGPCRRPEDFFTSPQARAQHERRLRYLIARYASFTSLLAWELGSELDYATANRRSPALLKWTRRAAAYLQTHDPYGHPVTTSLGLGADWDALWSLPQLHLVQPHVYIHRPVYVPEAAELDAAELVLRRKAALGGLRKPVLIGEFGFLGSKDFNPLNEADKTGIHLHNALWAAAMTGCAGTPLHWWWDDYVLANDLHYHYTALGRFFRDEPLPGPQWAFLRDTGKGAIRVLGFRDRVRALLWIQHRDNRWYRRLVEQARPTPLPAATVTVRGLRDGHHRIEWWDTYAGQPITHALGRSRDGVLRLRVPPGQPDVACKVRRVAN